MVRDFDFHPAEPVVRVFTARPDGVLRFSGDAYVGAARYGDVVLWRYAFAPYWFKVNVTTDAAGQIVETGGEDQASRFATCRPAHPQAGGKPIRVYVPSDLPCRRGEAETPGLRA
jgi:hypothetical protein